MNWHRVWFGCGGAVGLLLLYFLIHWSVARTVLTLPAPGMWLSSPGGEAVDVAVGSDWMVRFDQRAWEEVNCVDVGGIRGVFHDASGGQVTPEFPSFCGSVEVLAALRAAGPGSVAIVRSSGWPWRSWRTIAVKSVGTGAWLTNGQLVWRGVLANAAFAVIQGFVGGWALALVVDGVIAKRRASRGACPACGYDLSGAATAACPECGAVPQRAANTRHV